jgi:HK97 family phage major capsid protein
MGATIGVVEELRAALRIATEAARTVMTAAEAENRELTPEERAAVDEKLTAARELKAKMDRAEQNDTRQAEIAALLAAGRAPAPVPAAATTKSLGTQWVESPAFEFFRAGRHRGLAAWASEAVELHAATLTEDPASGGKLLMPQQVPGILSIPVAPPRVAALFAQGTATTAAISYLVEKTEVNAAAAVAEGALKPESTLTFDSMTEAIRKVATWLPVSEEMLADVDQIRSYIDARLRLFVAIKMDDQVLNGSGVAPNMRGILQTPGLSGPIAAGASETNADAIFRALMTVLTTSFLMPDGIVMNPADWAGTVLAKTDTGEYYGPGMFAALPAPALWGVRVVPTPSITIGTGLVGAFGVGGQFWTRTGIVVQASNSHADYFVRNLVAIRAEQRALLTVYRPSAFCPTTGLKSGLAAPTVQGALGTPAVGFQGGGGQAAAPPAEPQTTPASARIRRG